MRLNDHGIVLHPDDVLRTACVEVDPAAEATSTLALRLVTAMKSSGGIGLAAPQIGVSSRVFVVGVPVQGGLQALVMVNPRIAWASDARSVLAEGCLSIPGRRFMVERPVSVTCEYHALDGTKLVAEASGLVAKCIQHELDHLGGILICDLGPEEVKAAA